MMYRLGQKRRTTKQLFAILRQKVYAYCKSRPKFLLNEVNHTDVVFPGDLAFKKKKQDQDYGDPSIAKQDLPSFSNYLLYDFPLQSYQINFDNNVLKLLSHQTLFQFTDQQLKGHKIQCISSSSDFIVVGWSNGVVMIFRLENINKVIWMKLPDKIGIKNSGIVGNNVVALNQNNKFYLLEVLTSQIKVLFEYQYSGSNVKMMEVRKFENAFLIFISDSEGKLSKIVFKKTLFIQTSSIQLIYKTGLPLVFTLLDQKLAQKYKITKSPNVIIIAFNNSISCTLVSLNLSTQQFQILFQYKNFINFQPQNYNPLFKSLQFVQYEQQNQQSLMLASSFGSRLFFTNIQYNKQEQKFEFHNTRRIKFKQNIISIKFLEGKKYLLITESAMYYCLTANTTHFQVFRNFNQLKAVSLKIDFSYSQSLSEKITYINRRLIWVSDNKVQCCSVLNWRQLYQRISSSEALFLLYFLIISKYVKSPYLQKPESFKSLQLSFPSKTIEEKQILLQYYYLMNQVPPDTLAEKDELSQLLLPFIFNHQLDNLSNSQLENLVNYWQQHQVLLVEEIIMSGIDKGWEIAIKNAWMRALMKIAKMGDDYEFPLLKMCGYFILNQNIEELAGKYASQIIKYMSLGINKNLQQLDDQQEYDDMIKIFVKILLDKEMYLRLSKHQAKKVVSIFTDLFRGQSLNCLIKMPLEGFILNCTQKYSPLIMVRSSVQQIIYSHCIGSLSRHYPMQIQANLIAQQAVLLIDCHFYFEKQRTLEIITRLIIDQQLSIKATKIQHKPDVFQRQELNIKSQQLILNLIRHLKSQHNPSSGQLNQLLQLSEKSRNLELVSIDLMKPQKRYESILLKYVFSSKLGIKEKVFSWLEQTTKQLLKSQEPESDTLKDFNRILLNRMKQLIHINKQKTRQYIQTYFKNSQKKLINRIQNDPQLQLEYVELVLQNQTLPDQELLNLHINLLCKLNPSRIIQVVQTNPNKYDLDNVLEICLKYNDLDSVIIYLYQKTSEAQKAVAKHLQLFLEEWQLMKKQRFDYLNKRNQIFHSQSGIVGEISTLKRINTSIDSKLQNSLKEITLHLQHILSIIHKQYNQIQYYKMVTNLMSRILIVEEQQLEATKSQDHTFLDKLTELLGIIIMDLAREGQIDLLVDDVLGKYKSMSLREMKKHLKDVYSCMQSSKTVIQNILEINRDYLLDLNVFTRMYVSKSNLAVGICALCQISIGDKQIALLFSCGHLYHLGCQESQDQADYCSSCIQSDVINGMIQNPDVCLEKLLLNRESKLKYRNVSVTREQVEIQRRHDMAQQRKRDKLAIFDKKVNDLAIQAQIIQLRLQAKMYHQ